MHGSSLGQFGNYLREKWVSPRRIRFWLLVLVILYTLLGFFALPWIIQYIAVNTAKEDFGRELRIESVHINPYTLTLRMNGVTLNDKDDRQLLGWGNLLVNLEWSSIIDQTWTFDAIRIHKLMIQEERFASGETRLSRLAAESSDPEPEKEKAGKEESAEMPALRIKDFKLENGILRFADNLKNVTTNDDTEPKQVSLALQNIGLSVKDFTLQNDASFPLRLNGQLTKGGKLAFDGTFQLLPSPALEGNAEINELALKQAAPYLQQFMNVQLENGTLTLNGKMSTNAQQPFAFKGSASINTLNIKEASNDETLLGWDSLKTEQLGLNIADKEVETAPIIVKDLSGRVVINQDKTTNFGQLVVDAPAETKNDTSKSEETKPFGITIEGVELSDGDVQFSDNSLPLPFSTSIHTLSGEVSTLSSGSSEPARVKFEGEVAEYGLAQVNGTVHAWHPTRQTTINVRFRNLQIPEYSPYTVNFAGRKIADGTMDLDLDYTVNEEKLDGQNNLVLHDLKLGEKMESSDAMDLPLDLAIALLQDSDGVIDLNLPVSGDVGNPQFDFGKVIQQAVGDAIKSVVTAPFSFLANLVGADSEEMGKVEFPEGRANLLPPQRERIAKLREALNERPALALELAGPFNRAFDAPTLKEDKAVKVLQQRLAEEGSEVEEPSLTSESSQDVMEAIFSSHYPDTELEALKDRFTEKPSESSDEAKFDALAYRNHLAEKVIAAQSITNEELKAIANARAEAVRDALVNNSDSGISADRVRIKKPQEVDSVEGERIAMELAVTTD